MFGMGWLEILLILAIALIVIGPQKLPELAKTLGKAMGELKRATSDLKESVDLDIEDFKNPMEEFKEDFETVVKDEMNKDEMDIKDTPEKDKVKENE
ncbi:MAG: twin-arginine translocase subunit TatB [Desulfobacterales bacterium]|nr:twin-arginine translocase subunit TatB [Desulfobacterales bacterium]MCP4160968.1 twin-arginine translocase subunit TatB [Deltaproteobacteria bacterium]